MCPILTEDFRLIGTSSRKGNKDDQRIGNQVLWRKIKRTGYFYPGKIEENVMAFFSCQDCYIESSYELFSGKLVQHIEWLNKESQILIKC